MARLNISNNRVLGLIFICSFCISLVIITFALVTRGSEDSAEHNAIEKAQDVKPEVIRIEGTQVVGVGESELDELGINSPEQSPKLQVEYIGGVEVQEK